MSKHHVAAVVFGFASLAAIPAHAATCSERAATMLRYYNTTLSNGNARPSLSGGAASTNSTRPGATPITTSQQQRASLMVQKASAKAKAGDEAGCTTDLASANSILKYNEK